MRDEQVSQSVLLRQHGNQGVAAVSDALNYKGNLVVIEGCLNYKGCLVVIEGCLTHLPAGCTGMLPGLGFRV